MLSCSRDLHHWSIAAAKLRAVTTLNADLTTLDGEFNNLSLHLAKGERDSHNDKFLTGTFYNLKTLQRI